jgi:cytochrome c biogenesis protein CcmG, thiol:disulfide interchange protein DsbE
MFLSKKVVYFSIFLGSLLGLPALALEEGQTAPSLTAKTMTGQNFDLAKEKGHVTIIHFWASWCSICRIEMPLLESYYQQHKQEGLQLLAISMDDSDEDDLVRQLMTPFSFPAAYQRNASFKGYGRIWHTPMTFVIDKQGILRRDGSEGNPQIDQTILDKTVTPWLKKE